MRTVEMTALRQADVESADVIGSGPAPAGLVLRSTVLLVGIGGAVGSAARYLLTLLMPTTAAPTLMEVPWATLTANVLGCVVLGALTGVIEVRPVPGWVRPLLGVGVCGGFTTMSTLVLEGSAMIGADFPMVATVYALLTLVTCLGSLVVGLLLGMRLGRPDHRGPRRGPRTVSTDGRRRRATPEAGR